MTVFDEILRTGQFPKARLTIQPLESSPGGPTPTNLNLSPFGNVPSMSSIEIETFVSYEFDSSMLIPVDSFSFTFAAPGVPGQPVRPITADIREGDLITLSANGRDLVTGMIDTVDIEVDKEFGERVTISGRDLLCQLEDQECTGADGQPIFGEQVRNLNDILNKLIENTRIQRVEYRDGYGVKRQPPLPSDGFLFIAEPGESKLAALQRLLEPLNSLAWTEPGGVLVIGKPNMVATPSGAIVCSKQRRFSNVTNIKATYAAASIPTQVVAVWSGQEIDIRGVPSIQIFENAAPNVSRLRRLDHRLSKTIVTSNPDAGKSAQGAAEVATLLQAGSDNYLGAYAKRFLARANQQELIVQCTVPGHYDETGNPYQADSVYSVSYDLAGVNEMMYLYHVQYSLSEETGQMTRLFFCRLGTIVADTGFSEVLSDVRNLSTIA